MVTIRKRLAFYTVFTVGLLLLAIYNDGGHPWDHTWVLGWPLFFFLPLELLLNLGTWYKRRKLRQWEKAKAYWDKQPRGGF